MSFGIIIDMLYFVHKTEIELLLSPTESKAVKLSKWFKHTIILHTGNCFISQKLANLISKRVREFLHSCGGDTKY